MRRFLNITLLLILLGAVGFVLWKAGVRSPFAGDPDPSVTPNQETKHRKTLRLATAQRPEMLLLKSLSRMLDTDGRDAEVLDYDPDRVWMQLASGELDLVFAPLDEAVKAQSQFRPGALLFFSGLSEGFDRLVVRTDLDDTQRVAVTRRSSTDFLSRSLLPQAQIVAAESPDEIQLWLKRGLVQAALIDVSTTSIDIDNVKEIAGTSRFKPMPTVAVMSRRFAENYSREEFSERRESLVATLESWSKLISYIESEPELLRSTLNSQAKPLGIELETLLKNYRFLDPKQGREFLEFQQELGRLQTILELLTISGEPNLGSVDWKQSLSIPKALQSQFPEPESKYRVPTEPEPETSQVPTPAQTEASPDDELESETVKASQEPAEETSDSSSKDGSESAHDEEPSREPSPEPSPDVSP